MTDLQTHDDSVVHAGPKARVVETIRRWIQSGVILVGERLPPVQQLSDRLEISRPTVRAALDELERRGLIRTESNNSRVVISVPATTPGRAILSATICVLTLSPAPILPMHRQAGWWSHTLAGVTTTLGNAGWHAMVLNLTRLGEQGLNDLLAERPAGVVWLDDPEEVPQGSQLLERVAGSGVPFVMLENRLAQQKFDWISSDHEAGGYQLTRWLIERGCKRIRRVYKYHALASTRPVWLDARDRGHERAMREAGLRTVAPIESIGGTRSEPTTALQFEMEARVQASYLIDVFNHREPADALMTASDGHCFGLAAACRLFGREPGRDVLIVGYDNYWQDCLTRRWETSIPAATMDKQNPVLGAELVHLLLDRITSRLPSDPQHRRIAPRLVVCSR